MKKVKRLNNWTIKEYTQRDPMYHVVSEEERYLIVAPDGRLMEDRLTLLKAEEFCRENLDYVQSKKSKVEKINKWLSKEKPGSEIKDGRIIVIKEETGENCAKIIKCNGKHYIVGSDKEGNINEDNPITSYDNIEDMLLGELKELLKDAEIVTPMIELMKEDLKVIKWRKLCVITNTKDKFKTILKPYEEHFIGTVDKFIEDDIFAFYNDVTIPGSLDKIQRAIYIINNSLACRRYIHARYLRVYIDMECRQEQMELIKRVQEIIADYKS